MLVITHFNFYISYSELQMLQFLLESCPPLSAFTPFLFPLNYQINLLDFMVLRAQLTSPIHFLFFFSLYPNSRTFIPSPQVSIRKITTAQKLTLSISSIPSFLPPSPFLSFLLSFCPNYPSALSGGILHHLAHQ